MCEVSKQFILAEYRYNENLVSLVRLSLSLDFSWYDQKQVLHDLSLVKPMSILCFSIEDKCFYALEWHLTDLFSFL